MKSPLRLLAILVAGSLAAAGCGNTDPISVDELEGFQTLNVAYGHPGQDPLPCNDALPFLDGLGTLQEWSAAKPLFLRMTGANGTGGEEFFLELRAIWTDEGQKFTNGNNRIYFLVRYGDDDLDRLPDQLAYATFDITTGQLSPSPIPVPDEGTDRCDEGLVDPARWTRVNADGMEDQVMFLLTEVDNPDQPSDIVNLNREVIGRVGPTIQATSNLPMSDVDLWIWRAGRTNLQPVPQYADWTSFPLDDGVPAAEFSTFLGEAGFAEDAWIGGAGNLTPDGGELPYLINYGATHATPVPERFHKCPSSGRGEDDPQIENRGLPKDLVLWQPDDAKFDCDRKTACSRAGKPDLWSVGLTDGEFDYVQGWRIRVPFNSETPGAPTSSRDVRARGAYGTTQEKGYAVQTIEFMRRMTTGNPDDLQFTVDTDPQSPTFGRPANTYRMAISVFDRASKIATGSTEIFLRFNAPTPNPGVINRCQ